MGANTWMGHTNYVCRFQSNKSQINAMMMLTVLHPVLLWSFGMWSFNFLKKFGLWGYHSKHMESGILIFFKEIWPMRISFKTYHLSGLNGFLSLAVILQFWGPALFIYIFTLERCSFDISLWFLVCIWKFSLWGYHLQNTIFQDWMACEPLMKFCNFEALLIDLVQ